LSFKVLLRVSRPLGPLVFLFGSFLWRVGHLIFFPAYFSIFSLSSFLCRVNDFYNVVSDSKFSFIFETISFFSSFDNSKIDFFDRTSRKLLYTSLYIGIIWK